MEENKSEPKRRNKEDQQEKNIKAQRKEKEKKYVDTVDSYGQIRKSQWEEFVAKTFFSR